MGEVGTAAATDHWGIPVPHLPDLGLFSFSLVTGAFAVAAIVLVQGAGVAEAAPNPDGVPSESPARARDWLITGPGGPVPRRSLMLRRVSGG